MEDKQIIPLIHQKDTWCKMIIPEEVERKIRLLCREIHNIEWSGILFYKVTGSFEDKNLTVICQDIYQMDIGNGSYTEYTMNPSVASYMLDHDLIDCYQGHIHSHHNMSTFFSGTDTQELKDSGIDTNHFVSLIVNNIGKYTAGITKKVNSKRTVKETFTYNSFNDVEVTGEKEYTTEDSYLEWYNLDIEIQGKINNFEEEVLNRIKEIREEKNKRTLANPSSNANFVRENYSNIPINKAQTSFITNTSRGNQIQKELPFEKEDPIPYGSVKIDKNLVMSIVRQLITCSAVIPSNSTIDIDKWSKAIPKLYADRFGNIKIFKEFAEPYVDFLISYIDEEYIPDDMGPTEISCILAYEVQTVLRTMPKNIWIDTYIEILDDYII